MIEWLKAKAIEATDVINKTFDPFDDFTRPMYTRGDPKPLHQMEADFYDDLVRRFWGCNGSVLLHRIPLPVGSPLDTGDQAIWHGIYTGILALRYRQATDEKERSRTRAALGHAVEGLELHQKAAGENVTRLIRGVSDDLKTWQDDASNDSATGHLFGIYATWRWGPQELREVCQDLATHLAGEILANDNSLVNADGKPTTYGKLVDGWKTDPLRVTLALAIYSVAAITSGAGIYLKAYSDLYVRYRSILAYPKVKFLWKENYNDTHRAAIHLAILANTTGLGAAQTLYQKGLERIRMMTAKEGNVWVNALCAWGRGVNWRDDHEMAVKVLSEFDVIIKGNNQGRDNYWRWKEGGLGIDSFKPVLWNGKWMASQPLPVWMRRQQDFTWQRNPRSLDVGSEGAMPDSFLNGGDYLGAYWLSRLTGAIGPND